MDKLFRIAVAHPSPPSTIYLVMLCSTVSTWDDLADMMLRALVKDSGSGTNNGTTSSSSQAKRILHRYFLNISTEYFNQKETAYDWKNEIKWSRKFFIKFYRPFATYDIYVFMSRRYRYGPIIIFWQLYYIILARRETIILLENITTRLKHISCCNVAYNGSTLQYVVQKFRFYARTVTTMSNVLSTRFYHDQLYLLCLYTH